ncbi:MAG: tetratricopeptide repeat protein [Muribaculaceae bacterium]|nr:tetratricopeptide repeat protein [Muribaculaceae bacterium]
MLVFTLVLQACSTKKNTAGSRFWQALNTRYNVYYHGKTHYDEQIKELENEYEDDYSQHVFIHPAEARSNPKSPQPKGSFDRTIEKMQKAIALHSIKKKPAKKAGKQSDPKYREWMSRDEYNPFIHNAWYLLAKSEYMKGDFLEASATFRYIYRHFTWKNTLAQEAQVWEALCYTAMGWNSEADNVLAHVHIDEIEDSRVRSLANLAFADYFIKEKRNEQAIPYLVEAVKKASGAQKVRLNFLLGQLYEETGNPEMAYQSYKRAGSSNSSSYRTKFNARIKQSAVFQGYDIGKEVRALKRMTRYDRNKEYLDQIYYAIGNLYLTREDTVNAIENYKLAAEKSTRNGIDKAISQITLGGVYFAQHKYDLAQPCYAEAIPQLNEDYPNYKMLKHRSDVLDELAVYAQNVTLQDSLLRLSKMSEDEVKAVIKKIIDELKKKEKEEKEAAALEEYLAKQDAKGNQLGRDNKNAPQTYQMNDDKSWYFYNTATKNAGKTAFQQAWGNRKLEDNWRRRNKNTFSFDDETTAPDDSTSLALGDSLAGDTTAVDKEALKRAEDPHYEEYYLKQIPRTEEQIQAAHDIIQEGLYNMGVILKDKLEDFDASASQFNELLTRYPDNIYRLDTYYNMYLMFMRSGQTSRANTYRDLITSEFADSKYGQALQDPNYFDNLKNMMRDQENMYEAAYANYLADNNEAVHEAYAEMMRKYPLSKIMPKFMFIDALSYVTQRQYDKFKEVLKEMLQRYPETDITPTASSIVKQINAGRKLNGGGSNARGMLWSTRLSNDTTPEALEKKFTPFAEDNDKPQVFILLYPTDSVSTNMLLYEVARHNFTAFKVKDYDLEQMTFGRLGLLVVKGFENFDEVKHYRTLFEQDGDMAIPPQVHLVLISESNFQLLLNEGRSFEDYFDYLEGKNVEKVEGTDVSDQTGADTKPTTDKSPKKEIGKKDKPKKQEKADDNAGQAKKQDKAEKTDKPEKTDSVKAAPTVTPTDSAAVSPTVAPADSAAVAPAVAPADSVAVAPAVAPADTVASKPAQPTEKPKPNLEQEQKPAKSVKPSKPNKEDHLGNVSEKQRDRYEAKERERAAKQREKERKEKEKAEKKLREQQEQMRQDSIRQAEKDRERALKEADKARENRYKHRADSVKNEFKSREQAIKDKQKEQEEARKLKEKERKEAAKLKKEQRKQREKERKERQKQKEKERKEKAKLKKQQAKEKAEAAKQRQKEREAERKAKAEERKQAQRERQQAAKDRNKAGNDKDSGRSSGTNTGRGSNKPSTPDAGKSATATDTNNGNADGADINDNNNSTSGSTGTSGANNSTGRSVRNNRKR